MCICDFCCIFAADLFVTSMAGQKDGFKGERIVVLPPMVTAIERQDPLASSLYVTDIGYYPRAYNHFCERKKPITENVLIYCVEGSGWYRIGEDTEPHIPLRTGEFVILPAGKSHAYGADEDPWTIYWIHFAGEHAAIYSEGMQTPHHIAPHINSRISNRNNLFDEILMAMSDYENIENKVSLDEVAKYVGYSPSHFSALFRQKVGESPLNYLNILRIERVYTRA